MTKSTATATAPTSRIPATAATPQESTVSDAQIRYIEPGRPTRIFNTVVAWLTRRGLSIAGSRVLAVRGRKSGEWRTTPVNLLTHNGEKYLVAPRGVTQWVRNLRAADGGELRVGRRAQAFTCVELTDAEKPEVLRAYLAKWKWEVGVFFDGVDAKSDDATLLDAAPKHPVFRITAPA